MINSTYNYCRNGINLALEASVYKYQYLSLVLLRSGERPLAWTPVPALSKPNNFNNSHGHFVHLIGCAGSNYDSALLETIDATVYIISWMS